MNNNLKTKSVPFWVSATAFAALFLSIVIVAYRNMRDAIGGVKIDARIEQAEDLNSDSVFNIEGNAKHATYITINGREIFIQKNGDFTEKIALPYGYSQVTLFARDKFGKDTEKILEAYSGKDKLFAQKN